jgi:hypothetical protein
MRVTGSRKLRAKYIGPFAITKRVSPTSYELDLPANFKVHPVINIEYSKEFHASPTRFVNRPDDGKNHMMNPEDVVDGEEIEQIRGHRESRHGQLQYLCHYKATADHNDVWEHVSQLADNASVKEALNKYWNAVYHEQEENDLPKKKEKKRRKPRKEKATKEQKEMEADNGQAVSQKQRPEVGASEEMATGIEDTMADAGEDKITENASITGPTNPKTTNKATTSGKKPKATTNARKTNAAAPKAAKK